MKKDEFILLVSWIFLILGIINITRLVIGWEVYILDHQVPMWIYWVEAIAALYLSFLGFQFVKKL